MKSRSLLLVVASLIAICPPLAARASTDCADFISRIPQQLEAEVVIFDIEKTYSIEGGIVSGAYDTIRPIESGCTPVNMQTASPDAIGLPPNTAPYKEVAAGTHQGTPWVQFVHPSVNVDDERPGLSSSIVVYDINGRARSSVVVSSYHSWEGAHVLSSTLSNGRLIRCEQDIEFFSYADFGDIDKELSEPTRSTCESSAMPFPDPGRD